MKLEKNNVINVENTFMDFEKKLIKKENSVDLINVGIKWRISIVLNYVL